MLSAVGNALNGAIPLPHPVGETAAFETWIHTAARPSDSLVVTYGHANLFKASGLHPVYDHLWSLPMRVLDPGLVHLSATLAGPQPPTWVLEWDRFEYLGDAPAVRLRATLATHYHQVADICGHPIFLLDGVNRPLPADIGSCS
jgi:hypothetical protein